MEVKSSLTPKQGDTQVEPLKVTNYVVTSLITEKTNETYTICFMAVLGDSGLEIGEDNNNNDDEVAEQQNNSTNTTIEEATNETFNETNILLCNVKIKDGFVKLCEVPTYMV